jgi:hypothetical protein
MKTIIPFSLSAQAARAGSGILARRRHATTTQVKRARIMRQSGVRTNHNKKTTNKNNGKIR